MGPQRLLVAFLLSALLSHATPLFVSYLSQARTSSTSGMSGMSQSLATGKVLASPAVRCLTGCASTRKYMWQTTERTTRESTTTRLSSNGLVQTNKGDRVESNAADTATNLNGVFAVYKPRGWSSASVVGKVKYVLREGEAKRLEALQAAVRGGNAEVSHEALLSPEGGKRGSPRKSKSPKIKVGHGGTLDPMATGVLVLGVGKGCQKLTSFLSGTKGYLAEGLLGSETDTQDRLGEVTETADWSHVTLEALEAALPKFTGEIKQVPPMFSALRKDGKRLYQLAREGKTVEREARTVTVHRLWMPPNQPSSSSSSSSSSSQRTGARAAAEMKDGDGQGLSQPLPEFQLEMECGGGFYVRTLITDLARELGTRGHMTSLVRTKQGPFRLEHALPPEEWSYEGLVAHLEASRHITEDSLEEVAPP